MYPIKLKPATKDYIWGGNKLKEKYGICAESEKTAEAWVLSCHKDGQCVAQNGEFAGLTLDEIINKCGKEILGTDCEKFEFFPMLIKLIDACGNLSVQVHPSDEYALSHEGQYGKTEMWYVLDCEEGAALYYGFNKNISREEFKTRIENNTLLEVLNRVTVRKGDCFFIKSGTIHAIGEGIVIAEIQQNSNLTYRVYDYGRVGADGKPRELHIEKALEVTNLEKPDVPYGQPKSELLAKCEYFTTDILNVNGEKTFEVDEKSFAALLVTEGTAQICDMQIKAGECLFIPANFGCLTVKGNAQIIRSRV